MQNTAGTKKRQSNHEKEAVSMVKILENRVSDVWNSNISNLWRSDVVTVCICSIIKLTQRQKSAES